MRRRAALLAAGVAFFLIGAGQAAAAIQVCDLDPSDGAHSLQDAVQVEVTASGDSGIYAVWLYVDGQPYGVANAAPVGPYQYVIPWDTSTVPQGDHTLTALAIDWSTLFVPQTSAPVRVDVGARVSDCSPDLAAAVDVRPRLDADRRDEHERRRAGDRFLQARRDSNRLALEHDHGDRRLAHARGDGR